MGVYIKGMKMPKMCLWCPFQYVNSCPIIKTHGNFDLGKRAEGCPLVEVSEPHGDLIDRNALVPDICHDWNGWRVPSDDYSEECIYKAPAVIKEEASNG